MKLFVLGYARHGKDTFAEYLCQIADGAFSFVSSSEFVAAKAVYPKLRAKYPYHDVQECFQDRMNHRAEWHQLISEYNTPDKARLARELFSEYDIYVGLRCRNEFAAARELADLSIWVDRSKCLPPEPTSSNTITPDDCDLIIPNNGSLSDLWDRAERFVEAFRLQSALVS